MPRSRVRAKKAAVLRTSRSGRWPRRAWSVMTAAMGSTMVAARIVAVPAVAAIVTRRMSRASRASWPR